MVAVQLGDLRADADKRPAAPLGIPAPQKGPVGKWLYPGDYFPPLDGHPEADVDTRYRVRFEIDARSLSDLAEAYALTGEAKYGQFARKLFLAYAVRLPMPCRLQDSLSRSHVGSILQKTPNSSAA